MRNIAIISLGCLLGLASCSSLTSQRATNLNSERREEGTQSIVIAASPEQVRTTLVSSAEEKGTIITRNEGNMVIMENAIGRRNEVLDEEFGPSDKGERLIRIRIRFSGNACKTLVVQDLALLNNAYTVDERSFKLPGDANTQASLQQLKNNSEQKSTCPTS
ncbi:hypothetical protein [Polycladidibacter stylochi]|uniref:hypothetical protein n=1 Tax=Polycladidibacter stylochi TaxID=1807766 RepID=UPI00083538B4|nr:hypothetical protein [Pseudovibrio stylochi]